MSHFGEYLVQERVLDRFQLFRVLQAQDRNPGVRFGECVAALGYVPLLTVEALLREFSGAEPDAGATMPFARPSFVDFDALVQPVHDKPTKSSRLASEDGEIMVLVDVDDDVVVGHSIR